MRILEIVNSLKPIGGAETFAVSFSSFLKKNNDIKVVVLYKEHNDLFVKRLDDNKIEYIFLNKHKHIDLKCIKQLKKIIKDFNPDVIHTESSALLSTYLALKKNKDGNKRIPVFHTMHLAPNHECNSFLLKLIYKHIFHKKWFTPVAITESLSLESKLFFKIDKVPFVENGVDLSRIPNSITNLAEREYDVTVIGRFSYPKNHDFLVRAFAEIKKNRSDFKVAFIGNGELFNEVKQLSDNLNASFIDFLGIMPTPGPVLINSKIIALGSRYEANPLSLIEGMAAGCVVVSTNVGGIPNIVKSDNGYLFEVGDSKAFIEIINNVLDNIKTYEHMSRHNKEYSLNFSMERCTAEYLKLFKDSLNEH